MRIAIISDIHSNLPALEAVFKKIADLHVDVTYCLGDIIGYGPFPNGCVDLVRAKCLAAVKGNHDSGLLGETPTDQFNQNGQAAIRWTKNKITPQNLQYLSSLPMAFTDHDCTFVHATPSVPDQWTYFMSFGQAEENFAAFSTRLCFIGHTHIPVVIGEDSSINKYRADRRFIINVGSVGQPRDENPDAAFGLFDTDVQSYVLVRVAYDVSRTAQAIEEAGLPVFLGRRLFQGI
jgi:diadenosine tetraphosphatase ApaH/serine/threonine PP2A family protein phosphatase